MIITKLNSFILLAIISIVGCPVSAEPVDPECDITAGMNVGGGLNANGVLLAAAAEGNLKKISNALKAGGEVNYSDDELATPLAWAARCGHLATVKALIAKGADVNLPVSYQKGMQYKFKNSSALIWAASNENVDVVQYLLSKGAVPDQREDVYEIKDDGGGKFLWKGRSADEVTKNKKILTLLHEH